MSCDEKSTEHPLNDDWSFSYKTKNTSVDKTLPNFWNKSYTNVMTLTTIESFWRLYNNIKFCTQVSNGTTYSMFKTGILPSWEDPCNATGSSVQLYLNKHTMKLEAINILFRNCLLMLIGNEHHFNKNINGCTFDKKQSGCKLTIWFDLSLNKINVTPTIAQIINYLDLKQALKNESIYLSKIDHQLELSGQISGHTHPRPQFKNI